MIFVDRGLLVSTKSCGEVGNVGSYVTCLFAYSKPEILRSILLKLLCTNGYTLNYNGKSNISTKISACSEYIGYVNYINGLDSLINDCNLTALDLLHAGIGLHRTGNLNCHTDLNAEICGIIGYRVAVVTAYYRGISEEQVVVLVAGFLGVDSNNYTLNGESVALLSRHILLVRVNVIKRNAELEGNGLSSTVAGLYCSGELVLNFFG